MKGRRPLVTIVAVVLVLTAISVPLEYKQIQLPSWEITVDLSLPTSNNAFDDAISVPVQHKQIQLSSSETTIDNFDDDDDDDDDDDNGDYASISNDSSGVSEATTQSSSSSNNNNNNNNYYYNNTKPKPHFVLHIGIPKSGTTTIQCNLIKLSKELALQDSYYYIGKPCDGISSNLNNGEKILKAHWSDLGKKWLDTTGKELNETLSKHLHRTRQDGVNSTSGIILSSEVLGSKKFSATQKSFNRLKSLLGGYSVRIVVGYRRYFEWLPSFFFQQNFLEPLEVSYIDFLRQQVHATNDTHLTNRAIKIWSAQFDDLYVLNMHQEGDLTTNFVCEALPGPPTNLCRELRSTESQGSHNHTTTKKKATSKQRVGRDMNWLRLVAAVRQRGWKFGKEEKKPWKIAKEQYRNFPKTYPTEYQSLVSCLTEEEEEKLLDLSLTYEKEVVATATASGHNNNNNNNNQHLEDLLLPFKLEDHRKTFYEYARKGKYCEFDAVRALSNTSSLFVRSVFPKFATTTG